MGETKGTHLQKHVYQMNNMWKMFVTISLYVLINQQCCGMFHCYMLYNPTHFINLEKNLLNTI